MHGIIDKLDTVQHKVANLYERKADNLRPSHIERNQNLRSAHVDRNQNPL